MASTSASRVAVLILFLVSACVADKPGVNEPIFAQDGATFIGETGGNVKGSGTVSQLPDELNAYDPAVAAPRKRSHPKKQVPELDKNGTPARVPEATPETLQDISLAGGGRKLMAPTSSTQITGLSAKDSATANGFYNMPPDGVLCTGNGQIVQMVNSAIRVYSSTGTVLKTVSLRSFFGTPATTGVGTTSSSFFDPQCVYDPVSLRWVIVADYRETNSAGTITSSKLFLGITSTSNANGAYYWYTYELKQFCNAGACLFDYPMLGTDANGIWVSGNKFAGNTFKGSLVLIFSKATAYAGTSLGYCYYDNVQYVSGTTTQQVATIQPARLTAGSSYVASTQFALASWGSNSVWRGIITGTAGLATGNCGTISLTQVIATGLQTVTQPPSSVSQAVGGSAVAGGDGRMQQVVLAGGRVFGARLTALAGGTITSGVAMYVFAATTTTTVVYQRIIGFASGSFFAPAITAKANGKYLISAMIIPPTGQTQRGLAASWTWGDALNTATSTSTSYVGNTRVYCGFTTPLRTGDYSGADIGSDGLAYTVSMTTTTDTCPTVSTNWGLTIFKLNIDT